MHEAESLVFVGASAGEPVLLSGPPRRVVGSVRLRNLQSQTLMVRHAVLTDRSGRLGTLPPRHRFGPAALRTAEERTVPLVIALDPVTPAGEYSALIDLMGQVRPALLNVTEAFVLRVEPDRVVVTNAPERSQHKQLILTNEGNVRLTIGDIGDVELRDDLIQGLDLRGAIAPLLASAPGTSEELVTTLLALVPPRAPAVGHLSARMLGGALHLDPGRSAKIDLEITVAPGLPGHGRYRGRAAILTADLEIVVITSAAPVHHESPHPVGSAGSRTPHATKDASGKHKKGAGRK